VLFALGDDVGFKLKGVRRRLDLPASICILRDDDGAKWPKDSLLLMRIPARGRQSTDDETSGAPRWWLGDDYDAETSMIDTPPKALSSWKLVGDVEKIWYVRFGTKAPGQFKHRFNKARGLWHIVAWIKGKREVKLYKRGAMYRIELGGGAVVNDLGLVWP